MLHIIKKYKIKYILIVLLTIIFEIFICNYQFIKAKVLNYQEKIFNEITVNEEIKNNEEETSEKVYTIEIKDVNQKVNTIYINYFDKTKYHSEAEVNIYYTDQLFSDYERMYGGYEKLLHKMTDQYEESKMIYCDFVGETQKLKLEITAPIYANLKIGSISINKTPIFNFNYLRVTFIIFSILLIDYLLKSKKILMNNSADNKNEKYYIIAVSIIFILLLFFIQFTISKNNLSNVEINKIYGQDFVKSILNGRIDINSTQKVLEALKNSNNPYDFSEISKLNLKKTFDIAYYNGNTYVYYGILPALILLIPYYIITSGKILSIAVATSIFLAIGVVMQLMFMKNIIDRYFNKKIPIKLIIILGILFAANSKMLWVMSRPFTYELVTSAGYCMIMNGLYNLTEYLKNNSLKRLVFSSLFMALSVTCRPTLLLISIIPFIFWIKEFINLKNNKANKELIKKILIIIIPYFIVGVSLMIYNYIRFNNIFEFGTNYQVSVTDFRNFGFSLKRTLIGITAFLFGPLRIVATFPFIISENFIGEYNGFYYSQPVGGGFFTTSIIGIIIFALPWLKKELKRYNKNMLKLIYVLLGIATFIMCFASNKTGSLGRYMLDFAWMYTIVAIFLLLFIYTKIKKEKNKSMFIKIILLITVISLIINILVIYSNENSLLLRNKNLYIYYFIKDTVNFLK